MKINNNNQNINTLQRNIEQKNNNNSTIKDETKNLKVSTNQLEPPIKNNINTKPPINNAKVAELKLAYENGSLSEKYLTQDALNSVASKIEFKSNI